MPREPDMVVRLVGSGEEADQSVAVVGDQVITATPADVGKVVTVAADGSLTLAAASGGGVSDHGALTGLGDDDHPYLLESAVSPFALTVLDDANAAAVRATIDAAQTGAYVPLGGGTMTGDLVLPGNPDTALEAAPKQYVDGSLFSGADAPPASPNAADYEFGATSAALPSGWSWVNQGTASYDESLGAGVITTPIDNLAASPVWRGIARNLPAGSTWTIKTKLSLTCFATTAVGPFVGLALRESSSGKLSIIYLRANASQYGVSRYTSPTAFSADVFAQATRSTSPAFVYFAIRKNSATSFDWMMSHDGIGWVTLAAANDSSGFFTPDQLALITEADIVAKVAYHWLRCT